MVMGKKIVMRLLDYPLDPSETLTTRPLIPAPRVPNKGKGVYRFDSWLWPVFKVNGWELVGYHKSKRCSGYFRSPGGGAIPLMPGDRSEC